MDNNGAGKKRNKYNLDGDVSKVINTVPMEIDAQPEDIESTFSHEDWGFTKEFDSISAHIPLHTAAVSSSSRTADEAKTISSVDSNDSLSVLQSGNSCFPVISIDESDDDIEVVSPINCILSDQEVDGAVLETTSNLISQKTIVKKSIVPRPKQSPTLKGLSKREIDHHLEKSLIQDSSQLGGITSINANMEHVSLEVFEKCNKLDNECELMEIQLNGKSTEETCDGSSVCKILSVSSMAQNNKDIESTKSLSPKSKDLQLKKNYNSTLKSDVSINEEQVVNFDDFRVRTSEKEQENKCLSYSESNDITSQPSAETLKQSGEIDLVDIDALLMEPSVEDNMLEEFIDVEVIPIEKNDRAGETEENNSNIYKDKDNELFQSKNEFSPPKPVQITNKKKKSSHSLNKPIHHSSIQKLKSHTKAKKKKTRLSKSLLKFAGIADSSRMLRQSPKPLSSIAKDSSTVNSNIASRDDLDLKKKQIFDRISKVKNLSFSNLLDHLTKDDILTLGIEIFENEQTVGFARGLEPEIIVRVHIEEGRHFFIIKWAGSEVADIVAREEVKTRCPQLVIAFYEKQYRKRFSLKEI